MNVIEVKSDIRIISIPENKPVRVRLERELHKTYWEEICDTKDINVIKKDK